MDERLRFLARLSQGEPMSRVCREFGISRKTGYKIFDRYKEHGLEALTDRSRRPVRQANQLPEQIEARIVAIKREKPHSRGWTALPAFDLRCCRQNTIQGPYLRTHGVPMAIIWDLMSGATC